MAARMSPAFDLDQGRRLVAAALGSDRAARMEAAA
jgi:hypothetical protein